MLEESYQILGVPPEADFAQIKQAYFAKIKQHSPDNDPEGFKRVRKAYETLKKQQGGRKKTALRNIQAHPDFINTPEKFCEQIEQEYRDLTLIKLVLNFS